MGGASSFRTMLAISGFLVCLWFASKISKLIGVSSILLEVGTGILLGPELAKLIPSELGLCFDDQNIDCSTRAAQMDIARKGTEFCDVGSYITQSKYTTGNDWQAGFFGAASSVKLDGKTYCLDTDDGNCARRLFDSNVTMQAEPSQLTTPSQRRLKKDMKGKACYATYDACLKGSCEQHKKTRCATVPDVFTLIGHTGVALMIFESGLHFDFEQAKTVGPWACAVAILGTFLPLISGTALSMAYGFDFLDSLAAGTALAPTSVGIALTLLHQAKALNKYFGQAVMTAAFVDDVLSLILFSVIFNLGDDMAFTDFIPLLSGCAFMIVAIIAAVKVWPIVIKKLFEMIPEKKAHARLTTHDEVMWFLMFATLAAYATITDLCGTHLWGCFIAGMSFATQPHATHVWVRQVKRITCWWLRLFFGCTLAWAIPVNELFSLEAFWKGTLMGIGPCIASKVFCAPFMGKSRWVIGWAMVGRAEFAYFIAILASISPSSSCNPDKVTMMDKKLFAILVWALIYATIFAPLVFRIVLKNYMQETNPAAKTEDGERPRISFHLSLHLPDLEAEEEERKHAEMEDKVEKLETELAERNMEIKKLREGVREATSSTEAESPERAKEIKELSPPRTPSPTSPRTPRTPEVILEVQADQVAQDMMMKDAVGI